jgi:regulator of protease activity HflC (stomatin/prohibitin superfamily)
MNRRCYQACAASTFRLFREAFNRTSVGLKSERERKATMTLTLDLTPEAEAALEAEAARAGQSAEAYAARLFAEALEDASDAAECERVRREVKREDLIPWETLKAEAGL